jgi:hypothetical protein
MPSGRFARDVFLAPSSFSNAHGMVMHSVDTPAWPTDANASRLLSYHSFLETRVRHFGVGTCFADNAILTQAKASNANI